MKRPKTRYEELIVTDGDLDDLVTAAETLYQLILDANSSQAEAVNVMASTEAVRQ